MFSTDTLTAWILDYRYAVLFPLIVVEGPIVTVIAAFLASQGYFNIYAVYGMNVLGDITGDVIHYVIGLYGGRRMIERWGKRFGITEDRMKKMESFFGRHTGKTLVVSKLTHASGMWILLAAGAARARFGPFVGWNVLASLPKALACVLLGYFFGEAADLLDGYIAKMSLLLTAIGLAVILFVVLKKRRVQKAVASLTP